MGVGMLGRMGMCSSGFGGVDGAGGRSDVMDELKML